MNDDDAKRLAEIEQRANAATEGPWDSMWRDVGKPGTPERMLADEMIVANIRGPCRPEVPFGMFDPRDFDEIAAKRDHKGTVQQECSHRNFRFIAAARMDVPWLIEQLRKAKVTP